MEVLSELVVNRGGKAIVRIGCRLPVRETLMLNLVAPHPKT